MVCHAWTSFQVILRTHFVSCLVFSKRANYGAVFLKPEEIAVLFDPENCHTNFVKGNVLNMIKNFFSSFSVNKVTDCISTCIHVFQNDL